MTLLCLECSKTVDVDPDNYPPACPNCGSRGVPADLEDTLSVSITPHELRIICTWAERWAAIHFEVTGAGVDRPELDMQRVVAGIAARLRAQHPVDLQSLTLSDDLAMLADAYPGMTTTFPIHRDDTDPRDDS